MKFNQYQKKARKTDQRKSKTNLDIVIPLLGLVGEIGSVAAEHKKRLRDGQSYLNFTEKFREELGDVLWYIATLADDIGITLESVAKDNLIKTKERWADTKNFRPNKLFDTDFPRHEKLPRKLTVKFQPNERGRIEMYSKGVRLGDPLSDNSHVADGYRFHDVFHLSYMAVLGWSPVIRQLLKRKRKSKRKIDEVEDGARAIIIEEAISAMIYEYAKGHNYFDNIKHVDYELLKTVKGVVRIFEVKNIPSSLWEKAILDGYKVYRKLKQKKKGLVEINLYKREIRFVR